MLIELLNVLVDEAPASTKRALRVLGVVVALGTLLLAWREYGPEVRDPAGVQRAECARAVPVEDLQLTVCGRDAAPGGHP